MMPENIAINQLSIGGRGSKLLKTSFYFLLSFLLFNLFAGKPGSKRARDWDGFCYLTRKEEEINMHVYTRRK